MSDPPALQGPITRAQFAQYVTDETGEPITSVIQILEAQQASLTEDIPTEVANAVATANAAQATANATNALIQAAKFALIAADPALAQARVLTAGSGIAFADNGAGNTFVVSAAQIVATLNADVVDLTAAFVNAGNLLAVLVANSSYMVEGLLTFQSAAATTGLGLAFTLPAAASISGSYAHPATATASQSAYNTAAGVVNANTSAVPVAAVNLPLNGRWIITTGANAGIAQLQFRTAVAASGVTLKQSLSSLVFRKIG